MANRRVDLESSLGRGAKPAQSDVRPSGRNEIASGSLHQVTSVPAAPEDPSPFKDDGVSRRERIEQAAYRRAEQRGFSAGQELDDWLAAEREVDGEDASRGSTR